MKVCLHGHSVTVVCTSDPGAAEDGKMERTRGLMRCFCSNTPAPTHPSDALCSPPNITVTDCPRAREREHKERSAAKTNEESEWVRESGDWNAAVKKKKEEGKRKADREDEEEKNWQSERDGIKTQLETVRRRNDEGRERTTQEQDEEKEEKGKTRKAERIRRIWKRLLLSKLNVWVLPCVCERDRERVKKKSAENFNPIQKNTLMDCSCFKRFWNLLPPCDGKLTGASKPNKSNYKANSSSTSVHLLWHLTALKKRWV